MLRLQSVITHYGKICALKGISLHVDRGEIVAIIGPNGAGKTTTLNTISGILTPSAGKIIFDDVEITGLSVDTIVKKGLVQIPEGRQIFANMSVVENLHLGSYRRPVEAKRNEIESDLIRIYEMFPILKEREQQLAGTLSGGEQQMLAIGRALMAKPKLLLLDEPSMGLAPLVVKQIFKAIGELAKDGVTILIVEQNAKAALGIAKRAYVFETGRVVMEGPAIELAQNPEIQRAYLGKGYRHIIEQM